MEQAATNIGLIGLESLAFATMAESAWGQNRKSMAATGMSASAAGVSVANPGRKPTRPRSVAPWLALLPGVLLIIYQ